MHGQKNIKRLRMTGAIPYLPLCAFVARTGIATPLFGEMNVTTASAPMD